MVVVGYYNPNVEGLKSSAGWDRADRALSKADSQQATLNKRRAEVNNPSFRRRPEPSS
jgi:hypothetical protein